MLKIINPKKLGNGVPKSLQFGGMPKRASASVVFGEVGSNQGRPAVTILPKGKRARPRGM